MSEQPSSVFRPGLFAVLGRHPGLIALYLLGVLATAALITFLDPAAEPSRLHGAAPPERMNRKAPLADERSEKLRQAQQQQLEAEEKLRTLQVEAGPPSVETRLNLGLTRVGQLEDDLARTRADLAGAEAEAAQWKTKLTTIPETQVATRITGSAGDGSESMRSQLYALELKELDLLARLPAQHPEVLEVRKQVTAARELLSREQRQREQITTTVNRLHEEARIALLRREGEIVALRARMDSQKGHLEQERLALKGLIATALRVTEQKQQVEVQTSRCRQLREEMKRSLDEPTPVLNPETPEPIVAEPELVRPRLAVNLGVGLAVGLCGAFVLAWLAEPKRLPVPQTVVAEEKAAPSPAPEPSPAPLPVEEPPLDSRDRRLARRGIV